MPSLSQRFGSVFKRKDSRSFCLSQGFWVVKGCRVQAFEARALDLKLFFCLGGVKVSVVLGSGFGATV